MATEPPVARNLDPVYVRVLRDGKHVDRCFSDLTVEEQQYFINSLEKNGVKRLAMVLAEALRHVGDLMNIHLED